MAESWSYHGCLGGPHALGKLLGGKSSTSGMVTADYVCQVTARPSLIHVPPIAPITLPPFFNLSIRSPSHNTGVTNARLPFQTRAPILPSCTHDTHFLPRPHICRSGMMNSSFSLACALLLFAHCRYQTVLGCDMATCAVVMSYSITRSSDHETYALLPYAVKIRQLVRS